VLGVDATADSGGRLTSRSTWALIGALIALVGALALCLDRFHNGDFYLSLNSGRFIAEHGFATHDPFSTISHGGTWLNQQWLSELTFFRIAEVFGPTGLTVLYAVLITAPLALLLWLCRGKGWPMLVAVAAFYFPGVLAVIHPRAAGFTVLIFTILIALLFLLWRDRGEAQTAGRHVWWAPLAILGLFALWANLHGGFIAGPLLGLATVGSRSTWRGIPGSVPQTGRGARRRGCARGGDRHGRHAAGVGDPVLSAELETRRSHWRAPVESAFSSPPAVVYLSLAACFAAWMWVRSPRPARPPPLVTAGSSSSPGTRSGTSSSSARSRRCRSPGPRKSHTSLRMPVALVGRGGRGGDPPRSRPAKDDRRWTSRGRLRDCASSQHGRIVTHAGWVRRSPGAAEHAGGLERWLESTRRRSFGTTMRSCAPERRGTSPMHCDEPTPAR
jgi:hypothetical protein